MINIDVKQCSANYYRLTLEMAFDGINEVTR